MKYTAGGMAVLSVLLVIAAFFPAMVSVAAPTNSLSVKTGYYGYQYIDKGSFTADGLYSSGLIADDVVYTAIDSTGRTRCGEADGIPLADLLYLCGINWTDIGYFRFHNALDGHLGTERFGASDLLGMNRFSYPDANRYVDFQDGDVVFLDDDGHDMYSEVEKSRETAVTMLALDSYYNSYGRGEWSPGCAAKTDATRFRLMLGQTSPLAQEAYQSIQGVDVVYATYGDWPVINVDRDYFDLRRNEQSKINVLGVTCADTDCAQMLEAAGYHFESGDPTLLKVEQDGTLKARDKSGSTMVRIWIEKNSEDANECGDSSGPWIERYITVSVHGEFTVRFYDNMSSANGGKGNQIGQAQTVMEYSAAVPPEVPERQGYDFGGWDQDVSYVTDDVDVVAQWSRYFMVRFEDADGKAIPVNGQDEQKVYEHGAAVAPPDPEPEKEGFQFERWDADFSDVTSDLTIHPVFREENSPEEFLVTFKNGETGEVIGEPQLVEMHEDAVPPSPPHVDKKEFDYWDGNYRDVTQDRIIYARYKDKPTKEEKNYTVRFLYENESGKTVVWETYSVEEGSSVSLPKKLPQKEGYKLKGWTNTEKLKNIRQNVDCVAQWEREKETEPETTTAKESGKDPGQNGPGEDPTAQGGNSGGSRTGNGNPENSGSLPEGGEENAQVHAVEQNEAGNQEPDFQHSLQMHTAHRLYRSRKTESAGEEKAADAEAEMLTEPVEEERQYHTYDGDMRRTVLLLLALLLAGGAGGMYLYYRREFMELAEKAG